MSSNSPYPDGVSGNDSDGPGGNPENHDAAPGQGVHGTGSAGSPAGLPPGATSSGSAAFASAPPGQGAPQSYGRPAQYGQQPHGGYGTPPPPPPGQYGGPPQPGGYGQPQQPPPSPGTYGQPGQPPPPGYGQPASYGQPGQQPPPAAPQAPHSGPPEPERDMPMAGASPIRRNIDDTAELPAFLDSARSDESPGKKKKEHAVPEVKGVTRKFPLTTGFTALLRHRNALSVLVRRDLAVKYQATVMGYVWSLIEPMGLALIYWFIFGVVFGRDTDLPPGVAYALFIVTGIFAWQWFSSAVNEGTKSLGGKSSLITVMKVPREVFPVAKVFARFTEYLVGFPILIGMAIVFGGTFGWNLLWMIPAVILQAMLLTGMVFILSAINVLYKDVQRFLGLFMRLLFYASAVIYPLSRVENVLVEQRDMDWAYRLFTLNPLVGMIEMHRAVWIPELAPDRWSLVSTVACATFLLFFGRWIFYRLEPQVLKAL